MYKYAFPRRMAIFCLLIFISAVSGFGSTIIPISNDPSSGIFDSHLFNKQRSYRTISLFVDANGDYRSAQSGNWNSSASWERFNGTDWVAAASSPTTAAGVITIRSPHTVTISASDLAYDQVVIEAGAQVTVNPGLSHILNNGSVVGTDLIIRGTFLNQGSWTTSGATWSIENGGTYIHNTTSSVAAPLSDATLSAGSNFVYRGSSTLSPATSFSSQTYSNLAFESASGTYSPSFSTGTNPLTVNGTFRVGPNVNWSKSASGALNLNGDVLIEGSLSSNTTITIGAARVMTLSGSGSVVMTAGTLAVNGTLKTGASTISGAGNFTLGATGTLEIGSPDGITTSPTTIGSIRNTGSRTFNVGASYVYNGSAAQVTGNALPATVGSLKVDNATGVTLSGPTSVSGTLHLTNGKLITTASNSLSVGGLANSIIGGSTSSYVSGPLRRTFGISPPNALTFPIGKSAFNPFELVDSTVDLGTTTVEAEVFDQNSNGSVGTGLVSINTNRYWSASIISGAANFTSTRVKLTDSAVNTDSVIGRSGTVSGVYNSIGGTVAGATVLSNSIATFSSFVIGTQAPTQQMLSVNRSGPGKVTGPGIDCGSDCTEPYDPGTQVTLTATPDAGASFTGWSGACSGTSTCQVTMNAATSVTATFATLPSPTISVSDVSANEGQSGTKNFNFSVTLSGPAPVGGAVFDVSTAGSGSATSGTDYQSNSITGQVIAAGQSGPFIFTTVVNGDTSAEPTETFLVNLSIISGATAGDLQAVGTIVNDDVAPSVSAVAVNRTQGTSSNSTIANVNDPFYAVDSLSVVVEGGSSATRNGVTISNLSVSNAGVVTADVAASSGASDASFTLRATNGGSLSAVSTLQVIIQAAACATTSTWAQQQRLTASDPDANDQFGVVSISGDTAVVGAVGDQNGRGAVYVYVRSGNSWTEQAKLTANDSSDGDNLGISVAISGDTVIAGAHSDNGTGSAYVFTRSGTVWSQQQKLTAADGVNGDQFGRSVGIAGDTAVVGAIVADGSTADSGAAYVFTRSGTSWSLQQKLSDPGGAANDLFAYSVSISGDTIAVGAKLTDSPTVNSGSAYIFTRAGTTWSQQQKLTASDGATTDEFGHSISISGDSVVVGSVLDDSAPGVLLNMGSAYVFTRNGSTWTHQQKLTVSSPTAGDLFGASVGISGDTVAVGATENEGGSGSGYIFTRSGTVWTQQQELVASDTATGDRYGHSVALNGSTAIVGAIGDDSGTGSAYLFALGCTTPQGPEISISQNGNGNINSGDTYDFGNQMLNVSGDVKQFTVTNNGSAALTITAPLTRTGANVGDFPDTGFSNRTLQPAETYSFYLNFYPSGLGTRIGRIEIENNDSDENPFVINLTGTGVSAPPVERLLTVTKSGNGTGSVSSTPAGIDCGAQCEAAFDENEEVTLTASPVAGSKFTGWTGGCVAISATSCKITLNTAKTVTAQFSLITITGKVRLQNTLGRTPSLDDVPMANVSLNAAGTPVVSGSTGADGNYSLSGFGAGAYTVTPSKADQTFQNANGVTAFDAVLAARYVVGLEPGFTAHQIAAADVSGAAGVSSYDAALIARFVVGLPDQVNRSGKWSFTPSSVNHAAISDNVVQNYDALLYGDVSGDYEPEPVNSLAFVEDESAAVRVSLPNAYAQAGSPVIVPLRIENLNGATVNSYQFDIQYDPTVLTPDAIAADLAGTIGQGMTAFYNVPSPGLLKVAVFDVNGVMGDGVYANLRFSATGGEGSASQLVIKGFKFNDGKSLTTATDGAVFVGSTEGVRVNGRLITASGQGLRGTQVTVTAANGSRLVANSSSLGYFEFAGLNPAENYTLTVQSRRYRFAPVSVTTSQAITSVEMIALE